MLLPTHVITGSVDGIRKGLPEDSLALQRLRAGRIQITKDKREDG